MCSERVTQSRIFSALIIALSVSTGLSVTAVLDQLLTQVLVGAAVAVCSALAALFLWRWGHTITASADCLTVSVSGLKILRLHIKREDISDVQVTGWGQLRSILWSLPVGTRTKWLMMPRNRGVRVQLRDGRAWFIPSGRPRVLADTLAAPIEGHGAQDPS